MRVGRWVIWTPGLAVAIGSAVATAHGLYEVAVAAAVPSVIAWLYPLITDGLALVAYAATARLHAGAARYAWSVVVLAAGLSGLAQAAYLAATPAGVASPVVAAPPVLRFGIGAWPAVAAAIVAHLLYLLATDTPSLSAETRNAEPHLTGPHHTAGVPMLTPSSGYAEGAASAERNAAGRGGPFTTADVQPEPFAVQPGPVAVQSFIPPAVQREARRDVQPSSPTPVARAVAGPVEHPDRRAGGPPAGERARSAAGRHAARHGRLPTVSELQAAADVSRGTAAAVLKHLRTHPSPLHLITSADPVGDHDDDPTIEERNQP